MTATDDRGGPRLRRGTANVGGVGAISGPPLEQGALSPERQKAIDYLTVRADAMPGEQVIARFRAAVGEFDTAVGGFDEDDARTVMLPGEWTAAQIVDHLAQTTARNADEMRHL